MYGGVDRYFGVWVLFVVLSLDQFMVVLLEESGDDGVEARMKIKSLVTGE